jgi:vacuolar-type H+-ATPase subunit D/Vma8
MSSELKAEFDEKIKTLKAKGEELKQKIGSYEDEGEDKWDEVKEVLIDSMDSFKQGFVKLGKLFD